MKLFLAFFFYSSQLLAISYNDEREIFSMGSFLKIEAIASHKAGFDQFVTNAANELQRFENGISTWNANSQLSKFNKTAGKWVQFSPDIYNALKLSKVCAALTENHFHPGLGKLINIWGIRNKIKNPDQNLILSILQYSDLKNIKFDERHKKIKKSSKDFWFEEGGFAKGAALDLIVGIAREKKLDDLFLNFSGHLFSLKKKEVGIAHPEKRNVSAAQFVLENASMSTSSIGIQHFEYENKIYGHILNPLTGYPLGNKRKSVTVIHTNNLLADCLSTGLLVLSENKELFKKWLYAHPDIQIVLIESAGEKLSIETSCNLKNKIFHNPKESQVIELCTT